MGLPVRFAAPDSQRQSRSRVSSEMPALPGCERQFRCDVDGRFQRPVDGAEIRKNAVHALGGLPVLRSHL